MEEPRYNAPERGTRGRIFLRTEVINVTTLFAKVARLSLKRWAKMSSGRRNPTDFLLIRLLYTLSSGFAAEGVGGGCLSSLLPTRERVSDLYFRAKRAKWRRRFVRRLHKLTAIPHLMRNPYAAPPTAPVASQIDLSKSTPAERRKCQNVDLRYS